MNVLALLAEDPAAMNTVYNTDFGDRTILNDLMAALKNYLADFDPKIGTIETVYVAKRIETFPIITQY